MTRRRGSLAALAVLAGACGPGPAEVCRKAASCAQLPQGGIEERTCVDRLDLLFGGCKNAGEIFRCLAAQPCKAGELDSSGCKGIFCEK